MHCFCLHCIQGYFRANYCSGEWRERRCPTCREDTSEEVLEDILMRHCDDPRSMQSEREELEARQLPNAQEEEGDRTPLTVTFVREEEGLGEGVWRNEWGMDDGGDHHRGRYEEEVSTGWTGILGEDDRTGIRRPRTPTNNGWSQPNSGGSAPAAGADNDGLSGGNAGRRRGGRRRRRGRGDRGREPPGGVRRS